MEQVMQIFASQHGVATDRQVRQAGVTLKHQNALLRAGLWHREVHGVLGLTGAPPTWQRRVMAAVLAVPGGLACGRTAARLHRLDGFQRFSGVKVIAPRGSRLPEVPGVRYSTGRAASLSATTIDGIPTTTLATTLVHLAAGGHHPGKALDDALRRGTSPAELGDAFGTMKRQGVRGPSLMLELLAERVDRRLPRSWFQRIAKDIFERHAIALVDEWPLRDEAGTLLAELDLAEPHLKIGVECQSWEWHGSPTAQYHDVRRKRRLAELGWVIVEVWWSDLHRPEEVVRQLQMAIDGAHLRIRQTDRS